MPPPAPWRNQANTGGTREGADQLRRAPRARRAGIHLTWAMWILTGFGVGARTTPAPCAPIAAMQDGGGHRPGFAFDPAEACDAAITAQERRLAIPDAFLAAIARVESSPGGSPRPWPWTLNAAGTGHVYASRDAAIAAAQAFIAQGVTSLDVGCLQVNLAQHPHAFASLQDAFDPALNAAYGAAFLVQLRQRLGSWPRAAAAYHSQTPALARPYLARVLEAWAAPLAPRSAVEAAPGATPAPASPTASAAPGSLFSLRPGGLLGTFGGGRGMLPPGMGGRAMPPAYGLLSPPPRPPARPAGSARDLAAYRRTPVALQAAPAAGGM